MSKQSEAKENQKYVQKPTQKICRNCVYLNIIKKPALWSLDAIQEYLKCKIGDFAVKATATCIAHKFI